MKNLLIMLVLMSSTVMLAQRPNNQGPNKRGDHSKNRYADFTPEQVANLETKKMTLLLDLSGQQQTQINAIQLQIAKNRAAQHTERKGKRKDSMPSSEQRYAKMEAALDQRIAIKDQFKSVLNKDQFKRWEEHQKSRIARRSSGRGKRR